MILLDRNCRWCSLLRRHRSHGVLPSQCLDMLGDLSMSENEKRRISQCECGHRRVGPGVFVCEDPRCTFEAARARSRAEGAKIFSNSSDRVRSNFPRRSSDVVDYSVAEALKATGHGSSGGRIAYTGRRGDQNERTMS